MLCYAITYVEHFPILIEVYTDSFRFTQVYCISTAAIVWHATDKDQIRNSTNPHQKLVKTVSFEDVLRHRDNQWTTTRHLYTARNGVGIRLCPARRVYVSRQELPF